MRRTWIAAGAVGLLAVGVAFVSLAGLRDEADWDGVFDPEDNCIDVPNGPVASTGACDSQEDGDLDGYGNPCDTDTNNDGATGLDDVLATLAAANVVSTDPVFDFNCDGAAGLDDVLNALGDAAVVLPVGPSGLACAGTIPCP